MLVFCKIWHAKRMIPIKLQIGGNIGLSLAKCTQNVIEVVLLTRISIA